MNSTETKYFEEWRVTSKLDQKWEKSNSEYLSSAEFIEANLSLPEAAKALRRLTKYVSKSYRSDEGNPEILELLKQSPMHKELYLKWLGEDLRDLKAYGTNSLASFSETNSRCKTDSVPSLSDLEEDGIYLLSFPPFSGKTQAVLSASESLVISDASNFRLEKLRERFGREFLAHEDKDFAEKLNLELCKKHFAVSCNFYSLWKYNNSTCPRDLVLDEFPIALKTFFSWKPPKNYDTTNYWKSYDRLKYLCSNSRRVIRLGGSFTKQEVKFWEDIERPINIYYSDKPYLRGLNIYEATNYVESFYLLGEAIKHKKLPLLISTEYGNLYEIKRRILSRFPDLKIQTINKDNAKDIEWLKNLDDPEYKVNSDVVISSPVIGVGTNIIGKFRSHWLLYDTSFKTVDRESIIQALCRERTLLPDQENFNKGYVWFQLSKGGAYF